MHIEGYVIVIPWGNGYLLHGAPITAGALAECLTPKWKTFSSHQEAQHAANNHQVKSVRKTALVAHLSLDLVRYARENEPELDSLAKQPGPFVCIYAYSDDGMRFYGDRRREPSPYPAASFTENEGTPFRTYAEAYEAAWQLVRQGAGGYCWLAEWKLSFS